MDFTLQFSGDLKANAGKDDKHRIRKNFHVQMKELWNHQPLRDRQDLKSGLIKNTGSFNFLPLISVKLAFTAEIDIIILRPGTPGKIIIEGGDIDNRLKTLFDSFRLPDKIQELPNMASPDEGEDPFYCLLENDNLITKVSVITDRLLLPSTYSAHVEMFIHVKTIKHIDYIATSGL
jgi:hypothetical protein